MLITGTKGWVGSKVFDRLRHIGPMIYDFCGEYDEWEKWFPRRDIKNSKTILHIGAISDSRKEGKILWDMNYRATVEIAKIAKHTGARLIYISSSAAINPVRQYDWTKRCSEDYIKSLLPETQYVILKPFNIWGLDEAKKENPSIIYKIISGTLEYVYKNCYRDFIFVDSVVEAICNIVDDWWICGEYDLGTGFSISIEQLCKELSVEIPVVDRPGSVPYAVNARHECLYKPLECDRVLKTGGIDPVYKYYDSIKGAMQKG